MGPILQYVDPPQGMYSARLDDRGRLKLPAAFEEYVGKLPEKKLFCTSLDRRTAQVYPMSEWRDNIKFLLEHKEHAAAARKVAFNAADLGSETQMDSQGRILFSPDLRRTLNIENQPVHLYTYRGRIEVLPEPVYQQLKEEAAQMAADDLSNLEAAGLK